MLTVARISGFISLLLGLIVGVATLLIIVSGTTTKPGELSPFFLLFQAIAFLVAGVGLIRTRLIGIFGIGILALLDLIIIIYRYTNVQEPPSADKLLYLLIYSVLFLWFFSNKQKFSK